jgi:hypothetical protein
MKKMSLFVSMMFVAACGGGGAPQIPTKGISNDAEATAATYEVTQTLQALQTALTPARAEGSFSGSAEYKVTCADGGSGTAKVTANTTTGSTGTSGTATYEFTLTSCKKGDRTLTGSVKYELSVSAADGKTTVNVTLDGSVAYEGPKYAGTFSFNAMKLGLVITQSGTAAATYELQVAGTYTIGGQTYTVDKEAFFKAYAGQS